MSTQTQRRSEPSRVRHGIVKRPRVERALDRAWDAALTLVVAPAGYGKSVAVESWLADPGLCAAWVSLRPGDDDPVQLWSSVATAVELACERAGEGALARLRGHDGATQPGVDALLTALAGVGHSLALVLDDLDAIADARSLWSLDLAIARLPANVHIVALSRTVPRLRVARLRSQGALAEIGAQELAFTAPETQELFVNVAGASLDAATSEALTARTEGWPAALYLAALWSRDHGDPQAALRTFTGTHRHVADYLTGEVLNGLDADTRDFLMQTSVLTQLSGALCDAVLEQAGSLDRLRMLEQSNLFVIALNDRPGWYRVHGLMRDYLAAELDARRPGTADVLRQRALAWSRENGFAEDAAEYALATGHLDALAGLIEEHQLRLLRSGRGATLARWTTAIPRSELTRYPGACIGSAFAAHAVARPAAEVRRLLALATTAESRFDRCSLQILRATYLDDHVGEAVAAGEAAAELAGDHTDLVIVAHATLALTLILAGDDTRAAGIARAALARPEAADRPYGYVAATSVLAILETRGGRQITARGYADEALAVMRAVELTHRPAGARAMLADAVTAALEGRLAYAERTAEQAARASVDGGAWQAWMLLELAAIQIRRGHLTAAGQSLSHAGELLATVRDAGCLDATAAELQAQLQGRLAGVAAPLAEPPSPAELAVLRLLPRCTVREIAEQLYLSVNTIKSHIRAIYRKLGVASREDAVARAVALGLIDEPKA